jgi:hypothetical protein
LTFSYYSGSTTITRDTAGSEYISLHPAIPTVLYGKSLQLVGVEFCYTASTNAYLSYLEINVPIHSSGAGSQDNRYSDITDYKTPACHYYVLASPVTLTVDNAVNMFVYVTWLNNSDSFSVGRTTFVLQPTGTAAVAPSEFSNDVIILSQSTGELDAPSSSIP